MKNGILGILLLALTGCATYSQRVQEYGEAHGEPQWKINAIKHGCESGEAAAGAMFSTFKKDYTEYNNNKMYAQYWEDNFRQCRHEYENSIFRVRR